jgi:thymidylate synthase
MENDKAIVMPKKACMITLMFPVTDDKLALEIKTRINDAIQDIPEKRYTFQITET